MGTQSRELPLLPEAVRQACDFVRAYIGEDLPPKETDDALLLTSEVVTNAVRYASNNGSIHVVVSIDDATVRIAVRDRGPGFDPTPVVRPTGEGGFGLQLVEALSSRWGVERRSDDTEVWFEMNAGSR